MKSCKLIFGVLALLLAFSASAATTDLGLVQDTADLSNTSVNGDFSDTFNFTTDEAGSIGVSVTTVSFGGVGLITEFEGFLDGIALRADALSAGVFSVNLLLGGDTTTLAGPHVLTVSGRAENGGSFGGSIVVTPNAVPVPAAVWLFGSALAGLFGVRKKKARPELVEGSA